jgi:hypothetical protein
VLPAAVYLRCAFRVCDAQAMPTRGTMTKQSETSSQADFLAGLQLLSEAYVLQANRMDTCRRRMAADDPSLSEHADVRALRSQLVQFSDNLHRLAHELVRHAATCERYETARCQLESD